ncbi:MAG: hypothetical protein Q9226_006666 [Calogaya cf. arnoldii]
MFNPYGATTMVKRKQMAATSPQAVPVTPLKQPSKIPSLLRFPVLVITSMITSAAMYSLVSQLGTGDLAGVNKRRDEWWEIAAVLVWKVIELALGWWGEYDGWDLASLTMLSHMPYLYLLTTFYAVRPTTLWLGLLVDIISTYLPFSLLRDSSPIHRSEVSKSEVANRSILNDLNIKFYTSFLAAAVYGVVIYGSFRTWLPGFLIVHFEGLRDLSGAYEAALPGVTVGFLTSGYAAQNFLFRPALGAKPDAHDMQMAEFDAETATLGQTIWYNVWGYSKRSRTLIKRTAILVLASAMQTGLRTLVTIEGVEPIGAAGWAGMWATAATLVGAVFWWVGSVEGVSN